MPAWPGASDPTERTSGGATWSPTKRAPTFTFSFTSSFADASGLKRVESNSDAHGLSRSAIRSVRIIPAAVPFVSPHFMKPVATHSRFWKGASRPMYGTPSTGMLSCVDQRYSIERTSKRSRTQPSSRATRSAVSPPWPVLCDSPPAITISPFGVG